MDGLFSSMPARFFIAFVVVFGLIGLTAWLVRRFGTSRLGESTRGRQPRLAVIEAGAVDGRRRLVLIRRDNVEHLLMIGGPSDIVVEQNILRGQVARDAAAGRMPATADTLPRAMAEQNGWPLQPEPAHAPVARQARPVVEDTMQWSFEPTPPPAPAPQQRPVRGGTDALAGLAAELATRPSAYPDHAPQQQRMPAHEPPPRAQLAQHVPTAESGVASADQNLADMAQRLEAALRRPGAEQPRAAAKPAAGISTNGMTRPQQQPPEAPQVRAQPLNSEPSADDKAAFSSLEDEMASLLGRKG
jgi:flagellar biogenesis protein FliO